MSSFASGGGGGGGMGSPVSAKSRRRSSLAHAMKLVDAAIANLEGAAGTGGSSPASAYRRTRSMRDGSMRMNPLVGGGAAGGGPEDVSGARALLARLTSESTSGGSAMVSAKELNLLETALATERNVHAPSDFDPSALANSLARAPPAVDNIRSWDFNVFEVAKAFPEETMACVGVALLADAGLTQHFNLNLEKLIKFLTEVRRLKFCCPPRQNLWLHV